MPDPLIEVVRGTGPLVATAIHDGHDVPPDVAPLLAIADGDRLREEDPFTGPWATLAPTRVVVRRSRFLVDLNRPRDKAVYLVPADAWGLTVWRAEPPAALVARALETYDSFYKTMQELLEEIVRREGRFVVYDLHSYNHRREGAEAPPDDPAGNPEVNLGTGSLDRARWAPVIDSFLADLRGFDYMGRRLDVRENVRFKGGHLARWIHRTFPESGCALAIEFKKFFMDEWTGAPDPAQLEAIGRALAATTPGVLAALRSQ